MAFSCLTDLTKSQIRFNQNSSFPINELPLDILLEIFYKLPVKQLHRNKIVCKLWSSLISDRSFPFEFSSRAISPTTFNLLLTCYSWRGYLHTKQLTNNGKSWLKEKKEHPFKFLPADEWGGSNKVECLGSSNGLVLCTRTNYIYYVCNPTTKQWIILPSPPSFRSLIICGFVCNPNSGIPNFETQFKVVRFIDPIYSNDLNLEIFDSATNQWKVSKIQIRVSNSKVGAYQNFIEHRGILYRECRESNFVFVFDPNADQCYTFPLHGSSDILVDHRLDVSQNDLHYVEEDGHINLSTIWRCDELEGKPTWIVHRKFVLHDWTLEHSLLGFKLRHRHIDLRKYDLMPRNVLGINPVDCNIIYVSFWADIGRYKTYSMDIERKTVEIISSTNRYVGQSVMLVQPCWPTIVPSLPSLPPYDKWLFYPVCIQPDTKSKL